MSIPLELQHYFTPTTFIPPTTIHREHSLLLVDELLSAAGLHGPSLFPPTSILELSHLLEIILTLSPLHANGLIYYLLLSTSSSSAANDFVHDKLFPLSRANQIKAFHLLDTRQWHTAIKYLIQPPQHLDSLNFVDKILSLLATQPDVDERAALVLAYWRLAKVSLRGENQVIIIIDALCDAQRKVGVVEAWSIMRNYTSTSEEEQEGQEEDNDALKERLCRRILLNCFGLNSTSRPVPHHLLTLLSHPFTAAEDTLSMNLVLATTSSPLSPTLLSLAADWRISKFIAEGRAIDAIRFGRQVEKRGGQGGEDRARLLKALQGSMSEIDRARFDLELEPVVIRKETAIQMDSASHITAPSWELPSTASFPLVQPTATDLPLSASPFIRTERAQVSTWDGTSFGGVQKNLLQAVKESASDIRMSLNKGGEGSNGDMSRVNGDSSTFRHRLPTLSNDFNYSNVSPSSTRHGSPFSAVNNQQQQQQNRSPSELQRRPPTLAGFGSVRPPSTSALLFPPSTTLSSRLPPREMQVDDSDDDDDEEEEEPFGRRILNDPAIARTLAAAVSSSSPRPSTRNSSMITPSVPTKRRTFSSQSIVTSGTAEKKRVVSNEVENDETRTFSTNATLRSVPGGFPGVNQDTAMGDDDEEEDEDDVPARRTRRKSMKPTASTTPAKSSMNKSRKASTTTTTTTTMAKGSSNSDNNVVATPVRKSTRAGSVAASSKGTPKEKEVKTAVVRRSSRLGTPSLL